MFPRIIALTIGMAIGLIASAQSSFITGKVLDQESSALPYANLLLHSGQDSALVKVAVSSEEGQFFFNQIPEGKYWLDITFVGLEPQRFKISLVDGEEKDLGEIMLLPSNGENLSEVVVTAEKPLIELQQDKLIFNVAQNINAAGSNGLELLRKAPGVMVDPNQQISLMGSNGVRIYINGKPSPLRAGELASYLQGIPGNQVEALEIITNPGAKYEADGTGGIINIRLKKEEGLGFNGRLNGGYAVGIRSTYTFGVSGNYRDKHINIFGNYQYSRDESLSNLTYYRTQFAQIIDQTGQILSDQHPHQFRIGADLNLGKKSILGLLIEGNQNDTQTATTASSNIIDYELNSINRILEAERDVDANRFNINYNINFQHTFENNSNISVDANYGNYQYQREELQPNTYLAPDRDQVLDENKNAIFSETQIQLSAFKVDFEWPLEQHRFNMGMKLNQVKTGNDFQFFNMINEQPTLDSLRTNDFGYKEFVTAGYISFSGELNKKLKYNAGLRVENSNTEGALSAFLPTQSDLVIRNYFNWFPSGSLNYALNSKHQLQLSFSRRINRPAYTRLNPFESIIDELTFSRGNPFLQPDYVNNLQLRHSYNYRLNTTLLYARTTDMIATQSIAEGDQKMVRTYINVPKQHKVSLNFAAPISITDWWSTYLSATGMMVQINGDFGNNQIVDLNASTFNGYMQHTFKISKILSFQMSGYYYGPFVYHATEETESFETLDLGCRLKVFNGNGNLSILVSDIFKSLSYNSDVRFGPLALRTVHTWDSRRLKINFSYKFGDSKVKQSRKRKTALEDAQKRAVDN